MKRNEFIRSVGAIAAAGPLSAAMMSGEAGSGKAQHLDELMEQADPGDFVRVREDFPHTREITWLNNASSHPMGFYSVAAVKRYVDWTHNEHRYHWAFYGNDEKDETKSLFANLIGAKSNEIAYARSTMDAENAILDGMKIRESGGNVVTHNLHFSGCLANYRRRRDQGLDVRIVEHDDFRIDVEKMAEAVDDDTMLIAVSMVSNVNGLLHDMKALSELAHDHGAYLYADIVQAAGSVPINVHEMGIDVAACSTYKFLMGAPGFGFLYLREDLQGHDSDIPPARHDAAQNGMMKYEVGFPSPYGFICARESIRYIQWLGIDRIRSHVRSLTDRLVEELPAMGYPTITPPGSDSPIVTFVGDDPQEIRSKLEPKDIHLAVYGNGRFRVSPSVFNTHEDIDRLIDALA